MPKTPETIAPSTISVRSPLKKAKLKLAPIIGITALISFMAGTVVGDCNAQKKKRENVPSKTVKPVPLSIPSTSLEEQEINHMLFPTMYDLLYRPQPKTEPKAVHEEVEL